MTPERIALRRSLIVFLCRTCPDLVLAMKASRHVYPGGWSAYHLEDSVWTHTLLALQAALDRDDFSSEDIVCALVHDFAKPASAVVRRCGDGAKRVSFAGHGPLGTQTAVDFMDALSAAFPGLIGREAMARVAAAVSGHIAFYDVRDAASALRFCNGDPMLLRTLSHLLYCDLQGSVLDPDQESFVANQRLVEDVDALLARGGLAPAPAPGLEAGVHVVCGPCPRARRRAAEAIARGRTVIEADDDAALPRLLGDAQEALDAEARPDLVVTAPLTGRHARRAAADALIRLARGGAVTCTFALAPSRPGPLDDAFEVAQGNGLPGPLAPLVVPSLLHERFFSRAGVTVLPAEEARADAGPVACRSKY